MKDGNLVTLATAIGAVALLLNASGAAGQAQPPAIVGRWDMTVHTARDSFPSWLEVRWSGNRMLVGQYVGGGGSARPIAKVEFTGGDVHFSLPPQWDRGDNDLRFDGHLSGDRLTGSMTDASGAQLTWTATRAPLLQRAVELAWGAPVTLFNGTDLAGWHATGANQWQVVNGVLTSAKAGANLVTDQTFTDFKLHVEFRYPKEGNSGVYLRGRYEVQVEDSRGMELSSEHLGGVYGFLTPNQDAAKDAGAWQTFDITLVGRQVTVVLNGTMIICRQNIPGITGGALSSDEGSPGPIMLQGDHTPVEYRRVVITPAK
jgi:Domain of Unknown Function (DUF1080)